MAKIIRRETPSLDMIMGATIRTKPTPEGRHQASSPNYPDLKPAEAATAAGARGAFQRRLIAYGASGMNLEKANAANVGGKSRDPLTCG